jgi:threonine dehydrogenase-like Zn-dependent dehydrogenase
MKAIVVKPGVKDSIHMRDMPDPKLTPDQVAVRMIRAGLCATDAEISHGVFGQAPEGDEYLILGHENFGVVEQVGKKVKGFVAGDLVVSTVRRPCKCYVCRAGQNDMCHQGAYQERGIMGSHGFMAEYYVESPQWLNKIPRRMAEIGVLLEPMSVVEKGIDHAFLLQHRLEWKPKTALVLGAGPIGLLAAAIFRARGLETHVVGREADTDDRAQIASRMGATYHTVADQTLFDLKKEMPPIDVAIEATGVAAVAFDAMQILGRNAVLCLLSLTGGSKSADQPIEKINQQLVLGNQIVFGSVNANPRHFAMGLKDFAVIENKWPGVLKRLITSRLPWDQYDKWFGQRGSGIKTTLEMSLDDEPEESC